MKGYVYILRSLRNGRFYIGSTTDVGRRLREHNGERSRYTSETGPWELVFQQGFETVGLARQIEYKLKRLKSRKVLEMIILKGQLFVSGEGRINW